MVSSREIYAWHDKSQSRSSSVWWGIEFLVTISVTWFHHKTSISINFCYHSYVSVAWRVFTIKNCKASHLWSITFSIVSSWICFFGESTSKMEVASHRFCNIVRKSSALPSCCSILKICNNASNIIKACRILKPVSITTDSLLSVEILRDLTSSCHLDFYLSVFVLGNFPLVFSLIRINSELFVEHCFILSFPLERR